MDALNNSISIKEDLLIPILIEVSEILKVNRGRALNSYELLDEITPELRNKIHEEGFNINNKYNEEISESNTNDIMILQRATEILIKDNPNITLLEKNKENIDENILYFCHM